MSQDSQATKNKQQKHPKVYFDQYLSNLGEPLDDVLGDTPPEIEARLLINSHSMRRQVRRMAQRMRRLYLP